MGARLGTEQEKCCRIGPPGYTKADGIDSLDSIPGLLKSLKILSLETSYARPRMRSVYMRQDKMSFPASALLDTIWHIHAFIGPPPPTPMDYHMQVVRKLV
jgi:hypothetical protein